MTNAQTVFDLSMAMMDEVSGNGGTAAGADTRE